jgi:phosphopantetheine--protein transferase-like protein
MTLGLGLDVVHVPDFEVRLRDEFFVKATFTARERAYCDSQPGTVRKTHAYAGRYAAKEALVKALDQARSVLQVAAPGGGLDLIEVLPTTAGPPQLVLAEGVAKWMQLHRLRPPMLTISHDGPVAAAVVLIAGSP